MGAKLHLSLWGRIIDCGFLRTVLRWMLGSKREEDRSLKKLIMLNFVAGILH
jgi:hypothetical protein